MNPLIKNSSITLTDAVKKSINEVSYTIQLK